MSVTAESAIETEQLRQAVREHSVCFETSTARISDMHQLRTIGYDVALLGENKAPVPAAMPAGCERCEATWLALRRIAAAVVPQGRHDSLYEIRPFDRSLHLNPHRHLAPEIELVIEVRHRQGYVEPIDPCEVDCLKEISANLRSLGARGRN